jgi:3',5'-cyclic AMP phosphodiesterase CpdA
MRTLVHLSDLHFGRVDTAILTPLVEFIGKVKPDLVAVSGDLTQRARTAEFIAAREFLASIPFPQIVVPGNHDVPLHNLFSRFTRKLDRYTRYITADLQPVYADQEIVAVGVNTARAWTWKDGRINRSQLRRLRATLERAPSQAAKIVVTHHPFDLPSGASGRVVGRSRLAIKTLAECGVDLFLAGHFHIADTGQTAKRYKLPGYSAIIVSSGTTTSTRGRGQPNSFNLIRIEEPAITIERRVWRPASGGFDLLSVERFHRSEGGWIRE